MVNSCYGATQNKCTLRGRLLFQIIPATEYDLLNRRVDDGTTNKSGNDTYSVSQNLLYCSSNLDVYLVLRFCNAVFNTDSKLIPYFRNNTAFYRL